MMGAGLCPDWRDRALFGSGPQLHGVGYSLQLELGEMGSMQDVGATGFLSLLSRSSLILEVSVQPASLSS